jgi:hypothetical protein
VVDGADPAASAAAIMPLVAAGEAGGYRLDAVRRELGRAGG